jgi:hypothetical protein
MDVDSRARAALSRGQQRGAGEVLSLGTTTAAWTSGAGRGGAKLRGGGIELGRHEAGEVSSFGMTLRSSGAAVLTFAAGGGVAEDRRW